MLQQTLLEDVQEAIVRDQIKCRPIEGLDMPLREVRREGGIKTHLLAVEDLQGAPVKGVSF